MKLPAPVRVAGVLSPVWAWDKLSPCLFSAFSILTGVEARDSVTALCRLSIWRCKSTKC
ncbi:unnamed protein product, partial [Mycena citricolor]